MYILEQKIEGVWKFVRELESLTEDIFATGHFRIVDVRTGLAVREFSG